MKLNPSFIVFEGTECAGKTTIIKMLREYFDKHLEQKVSYTRAPGGSDEVGQSIRNILLGAHGEGLSLNTTSMLFAADYNHTLENHVIPALERGEVVVSDRSQITGYAYQHTSKAFQLLYEFNRSIVSPTLVIVLYTDHKLIAQRLGGRVNNWRDEVSEQVHITQMRHYAQYTKDNPAKSIMINTGGMTIDEVFKEVILRIKRLAV